MGVLTANRARVLIDGLNNGDCSRWGRNLSAFVFDIRGIGTVEVSSYSRTLNIGGTSLNIRRAWMTDSGANMALALTCGAIVVLPIEGR